MTPSATPVPVVIVGAGPVGLLLACELGRAGVPAVIVERLERPMTESRASQLSTLTAELLHERGFDALLSEAAPEPRAHFAGLSFALSGTGSEYAGNWKVPQYRTEAVLGERAQILGATLLRAHELTEISELPDRVRCGLQGPDGPLRIEARYVVGCDGARGAVRRLGGFGVSALAPTKELLRADVTGLQIRDRRFERLDAGFAVAATRDGITRVMVHAAGQGAAERAGPPEFGEVVRLWAKVTGEDISGGNAVWLDAFDNSRGQADSYRQGRVLLAGDAAHWHMPIGGQALNVGLQDAVNLGWKLAGTVHGWAAPGLLDSYHHERHPVGARMGDYVAAQEVLQFGGPEVEPLRSVIAELIGTDQVRAHLTGIASGLGDHYGPPGSPVAGRRITRLRLRTESGPLAATATRPVIVRLVPASADHGRSAIETVYATGQTGSLPGVSAILLRPDGYAAWAGGDEDDLRQAIGALLRAEDEEYGEEEDGEDGRF